MPSSTPCVPIFLSALLPSAALLPSPPFALLAYALLSSAALLPFSPLGALLTYMYAYLCMYFQSDALLYM